MSTGRFRHHLRVAIVRGDVWDNILLQMEMVVIIKMTGGTLEVSSDISLTLLTFEIRFLTFDIQPMDQWTNGTMEQWTNGPMDQWTNGPMDQWFNGPMA